jgi:hypothetical protein
MICFVMALKSKAVSSNWSRVCQLCEAAVQSAYRQVDPDFKMILVCHDSPDLKEKYDERLEILPVELPVPTLDDKGGRQSSTMKDKWTKLQFGLIHAGRLRPSFVMLMDADDLISNRIAAWAHAHPRSNGGVIHYGYSYHPGDRYVEAINDFDCGTNAIVNARSIKFPSDMSQPSAEACTILRWGCHVIEDEMRKSGTPLDVIPFRAGVYIIGHGDNESNNYHDFGLTGLAKKVMKNPLRVRPCTKSIREEFAMAWLPPSYASHVQ